MSAIVCPHCAAENRANAKYCRSCAKLMVNLETGELLTRKKRRRRRSSSEPSQPLGHLRPAMLAVAVVALLLGSAWWYLTQSAARQISEQHDKATGSFKPAADKASAAASVPELAVFPSYVPVPAASDPSPAASAATPASATEPPKPAKPEPVTIRSAKPKEPPRARQPEPAPAEPAPVPAPAASSIVVLPPPRPSPEQTCADQSFLAKAACMQRQCEANASHPQCQRMREVQDALRRGSGGG